MSKYVITWQHDNKIKYFMNSRHDPGYYHLTSTDELSQAVIFSNLHNAEFERHNIVKYTNAEYATTIIVTDRELFEARLKGD